MAVANCEHDYYILCLKLLLGYSHHNQDILSFCFFISCSVLIVKAHWYMLNEETGSMRRILYGLPERLAKLAKHGSMDNESRVELLLLLLASFISFFLAWCMACLTCVSYQTGPKR